jgi:ribosomal protein L12E/L44/L45/RPP1/RPP2
MKSKLSSISLTYSVILACGLIVGVHKSWGERPACINGECRLNPAPRQAAINNRALVYDDKGLAALPRPNSVKRVNDIAQSYPGNEYNAINGALGQGVISKQDYVDWMNDGLIDPLKGRMQAYGNNLQNLVDGGEISQEKADLIARSLGKNSAAEVTAEDIEESEKNAEEEKKKEEKKEGESHHLSEQKDDDKPQTPKPGNGGCGPGGCSPGGGGGGLGGGGGGGLLAGLGQAAMQMLPQLLQGLMQGMLQNQGNQQGLDNQLNQLTQEQLDQDFLNQVVFPTQTAIAQATTFARTAIAEETEEEEDTSSSNSEEETSEESERTPVPPPTPTSNPYRF